MEIRSHRVENITLPHTRLQAFARPSAAQILSGRRETR